MQVDPTPEQRPDLAEDALAVMHQTLRHDRSLAKVELDRLGERIAELERLLEDGRAQLRQGELARERLQAAARADRIEVASAAAAGRLKLQGRVGDLLEALKTARDDIARQAAQVRQADAAHQAIVRGLRRDAASHAAAAAFARAEVRRLQARVVDLERGDGSQGGGAPVRPDPTARDAERDEAFPLPGDVTALSELTGATDPLDVSVSVVIPTLNAGDEFVWLLRKLRAQQGLASLEIVIVDSGSTDRTLELAQAQSCTIVHLAKADFSHSHSRNLGADKATGELLLFMVQDAYPIGDYWLHALARALLHPRSEAERVSAVSATEYPRSDSELLYNALSSAHYRYLGCHDTDHVGQLAGEDNHAIRTQGQLSDITCLIRRRLFLQYRYHGRYAEDLVLGIQLIREGHKVGMISSVRTIHSHNRPAGYYVKRVFVDMVFLTEVFPDYAVPRASSVVGTVVAGYALQRLLQTREPAASRTCAEAMDALFALAESVQPPAQIPDLKGGDGFGYGRLAEWIDGCSGRTGQPMASADLQDAHQVRQMLVDQLRNIKAYAVDLYDGIDADVALELKNAALKVLAMTIGANLAFIYLQAEAAGGGDRRLAALKPLMLDGV